MNAIAFSNNDMVYIHWSIPDMIPNCLGFSVIRHDAIGNKTVALPAMVGFKAESPSNEDAGNRFKDTDTWPVQKYSWKDLFAERGGTYWYEIVPMIGTPDHLSRDESRSMRTNRLLGLFQSGDRLDAVDRAQSAECFIRAAELGGAEEGHRNCR